MKFNKLVRDKIPEILKENKKKFTSHLAGDEEFWKRLKDKLKEETNEFLESEDVEELADIIEVIYAICDAKKIGREELEKIRKEKHEKRGGFNKKIVLEKVENER